MGSKYFINNVSKHWLSYDISEGYDFQVLELLHPKKKELILDNGCGNGRFSLGIASKGAKVVSLDINKIMVKNTKRKLIKGEFRKVADVMVADCQSLPFKNGIFDKVLCVHNLHYIPSCGTAVAEMLRTVKIGGTVIVDQLSEKLFARRAKTRFFWELRRIMSRIFGQKAPPEFLRTSNQFSHLFIRHTTQFYSVSLPPRLYDALDMIPFTKKLKRKCWNNLVKKGFDSSAHRWLALVKN